MLEAKNIVRYFGDLQVLKGIHLEVKKQEIISIVGASGAGKSTLLQILGTLDKPDEGEVILDGDIITSLDGDDLARVRNEKIGFVFQFHNLLPEFTALENICMPALIQGMSFQEAEVKAKKLMNLLTIDHRAEHKPSSMSGGEQQRTAVARALINDPKIIFADEPSGNLDSKSAESLHNLFFELRDQLSQTFVIVTHNTEFANMADRKLEILDGIISN